MFLQFAFFLTRFSFTNIDDLQTVGEGVGYLRILFLSILPA